MGAISPVCLHTIIRHIMSCIEHHKSNFSIKILLKVSS